MMADTLETTLQALGARILGARIDTLEMRVTYQDEVIEELNKVIVEQWAKLDHALKRIERLENRIRDAQDSVGHDGYNEPPPPHY
ncbi:MAG: SlyX family protein [Hyphomicrobiaceae bacterium]